MGQIAESIGVLSGHFAVLQRQKCLGGVVKLFFGVAGGEQPSRIRHPFCLVYMGGSLNRVQQFMKCFFQVFVLNLGCGSDVVSPPSQEMREGKKN